METSIRSFTLNGCVESVRIATDSESHITAGRESIILQINEGIYGDNHGAPRTAGIREREMIRHGLKGAPIANLRQFSAVSVEELTEISKAMELSENIPYGLLGENLVISGIPKLSLLPFGTFLFFKKQGDVRHAVLMVCAENNPCSKPGKAIASYFGSSDLTNQFSQKAIHKRGVVGMIYSAGKISKGDEVVAEIPRQSFYQV